MNQAISLSSACEQDIPKLCDLLALLFAQEAEFQPDRAAQERGLIEIIGNPAVGKILVARTDEQAIAMLSLLFSISTALGGRVAWLEDMIVHPAWRQQGIASALIKTAVSYCQSENCKRITLLTNADNLLAQAFYRQHGFSSSSMLPMRCHL